MATITWDAAGERTYELGLDRGVLYLPDGSAVPWNGLVEVSEELDVEQDSVYYDGTRINELVSLGSFAGSMKAITYPDEFVELEGLGKITEGLYVGEQKPQVFALCYRTKIGNDTTGQDHGYKLHVLYNVTAITQDKEHATITDDLDVMEFEWDILAIPEEAPGFRPTAHIVMDSRYMNPDQLAEYEDILYGTEDRDPFLIPLIDFINGLYYGYIYKIIDHGDGTWTAVSPVQGLIELDPGDSTLFTLNDANAAYLADDLYELRDKLA